ncbi:MAG: hypothetical protein FJ385_03600 [Verrucomicrobia bacterium]|nr:hypothetical protein [Verrucomicrobiota bacterium]
MKHFRPSGDGNLRYKGSLRHYHRHSPREDRWDRWVGGKRSKSRIPSLRITLIVLAFGLLAAIFIGLFIEMR